MPPNRIKVDPALARRHARQEGRRRARKARLYFLVVCEGGKTEPNYFKSFNDAGGGIVVEVVGLGANTMSVVDKAVELKGGGRYDRVWAVFDRDDFPKDSFDNAIGRAEAHGVSCAWSNEAFELWLLYHFVNVTAPMRRADYAAAINAAVNAAVNASPRRGGGRKFSYAKNDAGIRGVVEEYGSVDDAIRFAEAQSRSFDDRRYSLHNPCTMVFRLVRQLLGRDDALNAEVAAAMRRGCG